jgi:hypothetical protein
MGGGPAAGEERMKARQFFDVWQRSVHYAGAAREGATVPDFYVRELEREITARHGATVAEESKVYFYKLFTAAATGVE